MSAAGLRGPVERAARAGAKAALGGLLRRVTAAREDLPLSSWRLSRMPSDALALDGVVLADLLERRGSPLHVVDAVRLAANAARFIAVPAGAEQGCEVFYSYETNPVPGVLRRLHAAGVGAEVVSAYELWLALRLGVDPKNIVYNGPSRSSESLARAVERGVGLINLNGRDEIAPLAALARAAGKRASVGIRVVPPGRVGGQLGERIDTGAAIDAFREALRHPELRVSALHAHYNDEIATRAALDAFLSPLLSFVEELRARLGLDIEILDVGGNLACPTVSRLSARARRLAVTFGCEPVPRAPDSVLSIEAYVARVIERVAAHCAARGVPMPRVFLEPGRAMTANAQLLLCRVTRVRDEDADGITWAVLDAGANVAEPVVNEVHQLLPLAPRARARTRLYRLTGPSCTLADQLYPAWRMPELAPGDGLAIMDAGAYFVPFATCFSQPRAGVVVVDAGNEEVLRRPETFEDLVALDDLRAASRQPVSYETLRATGGA